MAADSAARHVKFETICNLLESVSGTGKHDKRRQLLADFINNWRNRGQMAGLKDDAASFFPALRLLLPEFDKDRGPYGIKEV